MADTPDRNKSDRRYGVPDLWPPNRWREKLSARHARPRGSGGKHPIRISRSGKAEARINMDAGATIRRIFSDALRKRGLTAKRSPASRTRLDTWSIARLGQYRSAARQLVSHGHVLVNGRSVNIAAINVKAGRRNHH